MRESSSGMVGKMSDGDEDGNGRGVREVETFISTNELSL